MILKINIIDSISKHLKDRLNPDYAYGTMIGYFAQKDP
jgi:hypothetical protein